jgi:hypothetical protein
MKPIKKPKSKPTTEAKPYEPTPAVPDQAANSDAIRPGIPI